MQVVKELDNKLLHRKELVITLQNESTPSKADVTKQIAEKTKSEEGNVVIEKINSKFGKKEFTVSAKVYENAESKDKYETITRKARKKAAEEAKKAEEEKKKAEEEAKKAAEAPKEEAPAEESTDANTEETKAEEPTSATA